MPDDISDRLPRLSLVPLTQREARAFIAEHGVPRGDLFRVGAARDGAIVAVAVVGRPVARHLQDGYTAEVIRLCVAGQEHNACSFLLGACWRAARALGYRRLVTYTLPAEGGGESSGERVAMRRRGRRRKLELPESAARGHASDAGEAPMGGRAVTEHDDISDRLPRLSPAEALDLLDEPRERPVCIRCGDWHSGDGEVCAACDGVAVDSARET